MDIMTLLGILSAICTIVGFFTSKLFKSNYWIVGAVVGILTFVSGYAVYYNSEYNRIKNIHRQAIVVEKHYQEYGGYKEFIQASLVFLEENHETYPDTYERAQKIYADSKNQNELLDKHALTFEPETSIQAIADRFGFSEQASFARYFKKNTGVTPTEYREGK